MAVSKHGRGAEQVSLRLPDGLRDRLKESAERSGRSMNAEIVARLEGLIPVEGEGIVRIWLPADLRERLEAAARINGTQPDVLIREAIEEAYPYTPKLADYIYGLRRAIDAAGADADLALSAFVDSAEKQIDENPDLGEQPLTVPHLGWQVEPWR